MQTKVIKIETAEQAAIVLSAMTALVNSRESGCMYYDKDPCVWGKSLVMEGFTYIGITGDSICGYVSASGFEVFDMKDLDKFILSFIHDFASVVIPEKDKHKVKSVKSVKTSAGIAKISGDVVTLPARSLTYEDIEDIVFAVSN